MSIYAIGDLHLSFDTKVDKPMDLYGGAWIDHWKNLQRYWKETITAEDTVILAGDISWGLKLSEAMADLAWIDALPGKKVIFKGNHDLWWSGLGKMNQLFESVTFVQNTSYEAEGYFLCGSRGWTCPGNDEFTRQDEKIYKRELLRLQMSLEHAKSQGGEHIIGVLHFPPSAGPCRGSGFTELFRSAGAEMVVYGHLHGQEAFKHGLKGQYAGVQYQLVSLDYLNCRPVLIKK